MNIYNFSSDGALTQNSSGGKLLKWKFGNKFIKTSTFDQSQLKPTFLYESYAEVIVYRIAKQLGLNAIPYRLCKVIIDNSITTIACECDDFRLGTKQYISIGKLISDGKLPMFYCESMDGYTHLINSMQRVNNFEQHLKQTLFLDSLVLNEDRHYGNFGILQDKDNSCRPAPIFDNGNSMFCHKHTEELEYADELMSYLRCKPFIPNFNEQLKYVYDIDITDKGLKQYIRKLLIKLINEFELPPDRGNFIKELLYSRIDYITNVGNQ